MGGHPHPEKQLYPWVRLLLEGVRNNVRTPLTEFSGSVYCPSLLDLKIFITNKTCIPFSRCQSINTPTICVFVGFIAFTSVGKVLFPLYLEESLMEFHQTLQTYSYLQDKYF